MAVEFRCPKCGRLLRVEAGADERVRCAYCGRKVRVPAALAALPSPKLPPEAPQRHPAQGDSPAEAQEMPAEGLLGRASAIVMPWVLSALLHVGLFLIMILFVMVVMNVRTPVSVEVPGPWALVRYPGAIVPTPRQGGQGQADRPSREPTVRPGRDTQIDPGRTQEVVPILSPGQGKGGAELLGLPRRGGWRGAGFIKITVPADQVVFVVDRSGSMAPDFDGVPQSLRESVKKLSESQDFHVVFFANNMTIEGPRTGLVPATMDNKLALVEFLKDRRVMAGGQTTALPALKRAVEVFRHSDPAKPRKVVFLLTDGDFAGVTGGSVYRTLSGQVLTGNDAVVQWLRDNNRRSEVQIHTLLFRRAGPSAAEVLRTIADEHGGTFQYVSPDE